MISGFEVISILFLLVMMYLTFLAYKRKQFSKIHLIFWDTVWIIGLAGILLSNRLNTFLVSLNIARVFDLYTLIGFIFFLFMIFHIFRVVKNNEKRLEELTRYVTLRPLNKEKTNENRYFSRLD